jgi:hypothetical protein
MIYGLEEEKPFNKALNYGLKSLRLSSKAQFSAGGVVNFWR